MRSSRRRGDRRYVRSPHKAQDNHWIAISHWKGKYERLREKYRKMHKEYLELKRSLGKPKKVMHA